MKQSPDFLKPGLCHAKKLFCNFVTNNKLNDIHFIWLADYEQPDFNTINRFRNRVREEINQVFTQLVLVLAERGFITLEVEYIDGTKIESKANKYTFVWRKSTERYRARLLEKSMRCCSR